ncbi:MAG: cbb3-type cytochrome c oxidase subunit I [Tepidisphaeraceae bacterium]
MTWFKLPLFVWALYATAVIQILATPVLGITLLLLMAERVLGVGIFDPALGGDPVLYQHFFWFYSHPAVYIMILPAFGVISELIATFSHRHIFGYKFIALSSVAIALLGFLVWGHHMFVSGQTPVTSAIFSAITFFIAIPSAIKIFNWMATLYGGSIRLQDADAVRPGLHRPVHHRRPDRACRWRPSAPTFTCPIPTSSSPTSTTWPSVARCSPSSAASYYWYPKMFGVMYNEKQAKVWAVWLFIGFNMTFFPQFIAGTHGMPRRYASYPDGYWIYHLLSSIGAYTMGLGLHRRALELGQRPVVRREGQRQPVGRQHPRMAHPQPAPARQLRHDARSRPTRTKSARLETGRPVRMGARPRLRPRSPRPPLTARAAPNGAQSESHARRDESCGQRFLQALIEDLRATKLGASRRNSV